MPIQIFYNLEPDSDDSLDIGTSARQFKDLYIDGVGNIDTGNVDTLNSTTSNITTLIATSTTATNLTTTSQTATNLVISTGLFPSASGGTYPLPANGVTNFIFNLVGQLTTGLAFHRTGAGAVGSTELIGGGTVSHEFKTLGAGAGNQTSIGIIRADGGFSDGASAGVDGSFTDANNNTITVSGGLITNLGV